MLSSPMQDGCPMTTMYHVHMRGAELETGILTTPTTIHATDHQLRLSVPVLRVVPTAEAAFFFARWWAFLLLQRFRR